MQKTFEELNQIIEGCVRCPRLVAFREIVPLAKRYESQCGWRKPVPGFGDKQAWLLILGLAPAAQGGNRTGRIFTGDETGKFLMDGLHKGGFANQPNSDSREDGLEVKGCYLTASVKCVPPANKPIASEFQNCSSYFENEFFLLKNLKAVLGLGKMAFDAYVNFLKMQNVEIKRPQFFHGAKKIVPGWPTLYGSFHPSPQNTYTKKLTQEMFQTLLKQIKDDNF